MTKRIRYPKVEEGEIVILDNPRRCYWGKQDLIKRGLKEYVIDINFGNGRYRLKSVEKSWYGHWYEYVTRSEFSKKPNEIDYIEDEEYLKLLV